MYNLLLHSIIKYTEKNTSWEADSTSASQETATFYATRKSVTLFTKALQLYITYSLRSILILSFHPLIVIPSRLFSSGFRRKSPHVFPLSPPVCSNSSEVPFSVYVSGLNKTTHLTSAIPLVQTA